MQRLLSTYLFISKKLTPELLGQIAEAGFQGIEIFCTGSHFEYALKQEVRAMASALEAHRLQLVSLHAPTSRDLSAMRESGTPLSICEVERVRRIEAMDELKRVIDVADDLPYSRLILHMGGSRETEDPRKRDAAFSSLEHLFLHARHAGVTVCVENTLSEMGSPDSVACASTSISATPSSRKCPKRNAWKKVFRRSVNWFLPCISTTTMAKRTSTFRPTMGRLIGLVPSNYSNPHHKMVCRSSSN